MDALILQASRDLAASIRRDEAHLNSALAGAAHKIGFTITEDVAREGLEKLKSVCKRAEKIRS